MGRILFFATFVPWSVVINDFYVGWTVALPSKAKSPLLIDTNAVKPVAITGKFFKSITWR